MIVNATSRCVAAFFIDVHLLYSKRSLQAYFVRSCRDTYVFYAMYWGLYGDIKSFWLLIFIWIKMANYTKTLKTSFGQNERWQKHKSTWFDFVYPFALRNRYWFKTFFPKIGTIYELCDFKMGVALQISLQLANHKSQQSDFGAVCKANNGT